MFPQKKNKTQSFRLTLKTSHSLAKNMYKICFDTPLIFIVGPLEKDTILNTLYKIDKKKADTPKHFSNLYYW